ncbi:MAG: TetR/AcrR family transcriptional regulator [Deltaproteobacteria bacterium]|nr:TetR/AcrR family transcriptional regulator [Deltaproteobacteria bacterium]MBW1923614.1 TetR/AcrR family transcriptional regulator [Deltaproteobacteria bacterium]MBW1948705.1 TetR/AcrR family transcriptional regulator [Deltaproteobacteria bacterium]MBW2006874.1 TetR/AcrR family transcriptional regulator [Deltaproteobacteria bacterium]MBW2101129.1 TetR/AcrR family transcriptional regulator [Deltaproteobacteria bacterium]
MGIQERRAREKEGRREAILRAAIEAYVEEGYHATTMEKIAERAELSRATLYLYFKTKDEIFVHAITAHSGYFGDLLEDLSVRCRSGAQDLLTRLWDAFQAFYRSDPATFNATLYFHQEEILRRLPPELRRLLDRSGTRNYRFLCAIMEQGVRAGVFRQCDPRTLAEFVWTTFLGIVHLENSKRAMGRKNHLETTWELALEVLGKGTAP